MSSVISVSLIIRPNEASTSSHAIPFIRYNMPTTIIPHVIHAISACFVTRSHIAGGERELQHIAFIMYSNDFAG
jgi:hypothetical protein